MKLALSILVALGTVAQPSVRPAPRSEWPLARIITNLEARLAAEPENAETHYALGRAHGFAFALERTTLLTFDVGDGRWPADRREQPLPKRDEARPDSAQLLGHLSAGVRHLRLACRHNRELLRIEQYELTLAWLLETGAHLASRVDTAELFELSHKPEPSTEERVQIERLLRAAAPASLSSSLLDKAARHLSQRNVSSRADEQSHIDQFLRRYWLERAIDHYRLAVDAALEEVVELGYRRTEQVAAEAWQAYHRLVLERGFRDAAEAAHVVELERRLGNLEAVPLRQLVSPLLLSLDSCATLEDLIRPQLAVPFDLDGDAGDELWPWIAPDAGWLVWDPERRGEITSGQQLFGTASGWLFFEDGYRVLDALDDDRSGELCGTELAGIAVWFDRDTDGVSDRGEVVPVEELGIVALATYATERVGLSPANPGGVELADARVLPTYDWVLEAVSE